MLPVAPRRRTQLVTLQAHRRPVAMALAAVLVLATLVTIDRGRALAANGVPNPFALVADAGGFAPSTNQVVPVDLATRQKGTPIAIGSSAITAVAFHNGATVAYVGDALGNVTAITYTNKNGTWAGKAAASPYRTGSDVQDLAVSPEGLRAYALSKGSGTLTPINLSTNLVEPPIVVGPNGQSFVLSPDGGTAWVVMPATSTITPFDVYRRVPISGPITVGSNPTAAVMSPDGGFLFVAAKDGTVTTVDTRKLAAVHSVAIPAASFEKAALTPTNNLLYVTETSGRVDAIDPLADPENSKRPRVLIDTSVVSGASSVAISPDATFAWVTSSGGNVALLPVPVMTTSPEGVVTWTASTLSPATIAGFAAPSAVALSPDQPAVAKLVLAAASTTTTCPVSAPPGVSWPCVNPGTSVSFDASASVGTSTAPSTYTFNFGDGTPFVTQTAPTASHTYTNPGTYTVGVLVTDAAGTGYQGVYTGRTILRNGSQQAVAYGLVTVVGSALNITDPVLFVADALAGSIVPVAIPPGGSPTVGTAQPAGAYPLYLAVDPSGRAVVAANYSTDTVSVVAACPNGGTYTYAKGNGLPTGKSPTSVAITPVPLEQTNDHSTYVVFVTNSGSNDLTRYLLTVNNVPCTASLSSPVSVSTSTIPLAAAPYAVALTPDSHTALVVNTTQNSVTPVDLITNTPQSPIPVGLAPHRISVTPDGTRAYVVNHDAGTVTPIDLAKGQALDAITVGSQPEDIALSPDGSMAYVTLTGDRALAPINLSTGKVQKLIAMPSAPTGIFIGADGERAYVSSYAGGTVTPVELKTGTLLPAITGFKGPIGLAITPDQSVLAKLALSAPATAPCPSDPPAGLPSVCVNTGVAVTFDASKSTSSTSPIATYFWNFGDGSTSTTTTPTVTHTYSVPGAFTVGVLVTDQVGTSYVRSFTGQTLTRNGSQQAIALGYVGVTQNIPTGSPLLFVSNYVPGQITPVAASGSSLRLGTAFNTGASPTYLAVDPTGHAVVSVNYHGDSVSLASVCPVNGTVSFTPLGSQPTEPLPSSVTIDPVAVTSTTTQKTYNVYVANSGANTIHRYTLNVSTSPCSATLSTPVPIQASIIPAGSAPYAVAIVHKVTSNGSTTFAYVANSGHNTVTPVNLSTGAAGVPIVVGLNPHRLVATPDGSQVWVVNHDAGTVQSINTATDSAGTPITVGTNPEDIAMSPDGARAYVTVTTSGSLAVVDLRGGSAFTVPVSAPQSVAVAPDGKTVYVTSYVNTSVTPVTFKADGTPLVGLAQPGFPSAVGIVASPAP